MIIFKYFLLLGPFPQVFEEVKEKLMLELPKVIRMSHVVSCPIVFMSEVGREECSKL